MPTSTPAAVNPLIESLTEYQKKGVGVDMVLKSVLGIVRLFMLYSTTPEEQKKYAMVADAIVECRMLCNFGRPSLTLRQGIQSYRKKGKFEFFYWLFTTLSYLLRVPEQISGDLNYMQKIIFHTWSRQRLSFYYRFFKSLNLTCAFIAEGLRRKALLLESRRACTPEVMKRIHDETKVADMILVRTLCDMYVYYKWIPSYTPNRTIEYICGSVSGLLGVWLVWKDVRYPCAAAAPGSASSTNGNAVSHEKAKVEDRQEEPTSPCVKPTLPRMNSTAVASADE